MLGYEKVVGARNSVSYIYDMKQPADRLTTEFITLQMKYLLADLLRIVYQQQKKSSSLSITGYELIKVVGRTFRLTTGLFR